jgi:hemolysin activation/secretion protein
VIHNLKKYSTSLLVAGLAFCAISNQAYATSIPSSAETSRINQNILLPSPSLPEIDITEEKTSDTNQPLLADAEKITFLFRSLQFDGLKTFQPRELQSLYKNKIGQIISLADLQKIANQVQKYYADQGFALTRVIIPEQDVTEGVVRFQVIEGYVSDVKLEDLSGEEEIIQDAVRKIKSMRPVNIKKLERILLLLNDRPALNVAAILDKPTEQTADGALLLILKKEKNPNFAGSISISNEFSQFTGPYQIRADASLAHPYWNYASTNLYLTSDAKYD